MPTRAEVEAEVLPCGCRAWTVEQGCTPEHRCCDCQDSGDVCASCGAAGEPEPEVDFDGLARIPQLYRMARLGNWETPPDEAALLTATRFCEQWPPEKPFLALLSPQKGNGKTRLAISVLYEVWARRRQRGCFWPVVDLLDAYRATNREGAEQTLEGLERHLRRMPLLVIDDLGAQKETDYARERLYGLLNFRYNEMRPTIITANVSAGQLDERIASRIQDRRLSQVEVLTGGDRRKLRV